MKLVVVRHGETIENAKDIVMGQHDGTLSEKGIEQAKTAAEELKTENLDQAWSSDLKRCVDTARYIIQFHPDLQLRTTPALREVNYGEFQGRPGAEIRAYFDKNGGFTQTSKAPGGESHIEMARRVTDFVNQLLPDHKDQTILIVSHNGPIEAIRAAIEQTPFNTDALNAGIKVFEISNELQLYRD